MNKEIVDESGRSWRIISLWGLLCFQKINVDKDRNFQAVIGKWVNVGTTECLVNVYGPQPFLRN